jgi:superfamily II DNA/RNA helicase
MQDFKNNKATLLICTPEAERGLDMPGVDYVYSLDAPTTAASYLHRAGRCGRLGAISSGVVTTIVTPEVGTNTHCSPRHRHVFQTIVS